MFTGIVEETGFIKKIAKHSSGLTVETACKIVLEDTKIGDSISINGCCQTVVEMSKDSFTVNMSPETLKITTFNSINAGHTVNLERAMTPSSRLGGHFVTGHVDCTGIFIAKTQAGDFYELSFEVPHEFSKYMVKKGSVTIDGISLTVADIRENNFKIAIIPHTFENTNLKNLKSGVIVNIETDIIGKYVENFVSLRDNKSKIDEKFLAENGFI